MSTTVATLAEVNRARLFLRLIGAHVTDNQLILAVVAFLRVEKYATDAEVRAAAKMLLSKSVYTPVTTPQPYGGVGDYNARLKASADAYKLILAAARHDLAADFLYALALSSWDANHFGGYSAAGIKTSDNRLFKTYAQFTGLTLPTPKQTQAKATPIPKPPTVLRPPNLQNNFLDPYAARGFYNQRHRGQRLQTLDTVALGE